MSDMKEQKNLIESGDWDYLAILDACRYDCFEKVFGDYFGEELKKVHPCVLPSNA